MFKLIVGLGNPGRSFKNTRHNIGFMVIDDVAKRFNIHLRKSIFLKARMATKGNLILAKPYTFMNLSGVAVRRIIDKFSLPLENLLVVCDDCDLPLGTIRIRKTGSAGGHKGLSSIIDNLQSQDISRVRIGIGRPQNPSKDISSFVLEAFSLKEEPQVSEVLNRASSCVLEWLQEDIEKVMSKFN